MNIFIKEFDFPNTRTVILDKMVIDNLVKFLIEIKIAKDKTSATVEASTIEALMWLKKFLDYFKKDYEQW